jgi:hypothetical protein
LRNLSVWFPDALPKVRRASVAPASLLIVRFDCAVTSPAISAVDLSVVAPLTVTAPEKLATPSIVSDEPEIEPTTESDLLN